jgi:hypothetical protein
LQKKRAHPYRNAIRDAFGNQVPHGVVHKKYSLGFHKLNTERRYLLEKACAQLFLGHLIKLVDMMVHFNRRDRLAIAAIQRRIAGRYYAVGRSACINGMITPRCIIAVNKSVTLSDASAHATVTLQSCCWAADLVFPLDADRGQLSVPIGHLIYFYPAILLALVRQFRFHGLPAVPAI